MLPKATGIGAPNLSHSRAMAAPTPRQEQIARARVTGFGKTRANDSPARNESPSTAPKKTALTAVIDRRTRSRVGSATMTSVGTTCFNLLIILPLYTLLCSYYTDISALHETKLRLATQDLHFSLLCEDPSARVSPFPFVAVLALTTPHQADNRASHATSESPPESSGCAYRNAAKHAGRAAGITRR